MSLYDVFRVGSLTNICPYSGLVADIVFTCTTSHMPLRMKTLTMHCLVLMAKSNTHLCLHSLTHHPCVQVLATPWRVAAAAQGPNSSRISRCSAESGPIRGAFNWTTSVKKTRWGWGDETKPH